MANKPGKKDTAPRSTVSVYKREVFPVPKKPALRTRKTASAPPTPPVAKMPKQKAKPAAAARIEQTVPVKKSPQRKRPLKAELIKSIYYGHDFGTDEIVREADLVRAGRKITSAAPKESVPEVVAAEKPVTLPNAINERLLSKQRALSKWYHEVFPRRAGRTLTIVGFGFVLAGAAGLVPFVREAYPNWMAFQSTLWCEVRMCDATVANSAVSDQLASLMAAQTPNAAVTFLTQPPEVVTGTSTTIVRAEYVADLRVYAENVVTGAQVQLPFVGPPAGSDYTAELSSALLPAGKYQVRVEAKAARDLTKVMFSGATFTVDTDATETELINPVADEYTLTAANETGEVPSSATSTSTSTETEVEDSTGEVVADVSADDFEYTVRGSVLSVTVTATATQMVEVYAQRTNATVPLFLGLGKHTSDATWILQYQTDALPVGTYQLYARKVSAGAAIETDRVSFRFTGVKAGVRVATSTPATRDTAEALSILRSERSFPVRSEYLTALLPELEAAPVVKQLLSENSGTVNRLLLHHVSIAQANNESLAALANEVAVDEIDRMAATAALSGEGGRSVSQWKSDLTDAMLDLQGLADASERSLTERSGRSLIADTDADGLGDYDEQVEYDTDPLLPDTDADGITDAIEVIGQFSADNSSDEAVLAYASPYEWGVTVPELLAVTGVAPLIETDTARGVPSVMSEITGKAPPGSVVTLFIFSTPIVATVRADEQGSFVYQLEKPLDDGEHTVFVGLLDNRGTVIAKSEPYVFTKSHEFFRVQRDGEVATVAASGVWSPTTSDLANIVIALCVMILGLGSLLIGYRLLRTKEDEETVVAASATVEPSAARPG